MYLLNLLGLTRIVVIFSVIYIYNEWLTKIILVPFFFICLANKLRRYVNLPQTTPTHPIILDSDDSDNQDDIHPISQNQFVQVLSKHGNFFCLSVQLY